MQKNQFIVKQAASFYQQGDYKSALSFYKKAAEKYGQNLFNGNIQLCEKKLSGKSLSTPLTLPPQAMQVTGNTEQQLQHTQQLLEHYYKRTQELEYQLLDR